MNRTQIAIGVTVAALSWYGMMAVHEAGHCLGAMATGAGIEAVDVPLVGFSRTDLSGGRCPLLAVGAGPVFGATAPLLLLGVARRLGRRARHAALFFAGFCLLVNGLYMGIGAFLQAGDCRDLLEHGAPLALLVGFGLASTAGGLYAWHRLGPVREWYGADPAGMGRDRGPRPEGKA